MLVTSATASFVIFLYADGEIQRSNGQAGINAGDGVNFITIPSNTNVTQTSNVDIPGVWMFQVDRGNAHMYVLLSKYTLAHTYKCEHLFSSS